MASKLANSIKRTISTSSKLFASHGGPTAGHDGGVKTWKMITFLVALPGVSVCMANAYLKHEHHEQPPFIPYEHLRLRGKRFPWGEGNTSLFHNPHVNALPDGYESH